MKEKMRKALASLECCNTFDDMKVELQTIAEDYGFSGYECLDIGSPQFNVSVYQSETARTWGDDYTFDQSIEVDSCLSNARRTSTPFFIEYMNANDQDNSVAYHGVRDGLIVPYHFVDPIGRIYSNLIVFFWQNGITDFRVMMKQNQTELHVIMVHWAQRAMDLALKEFGWREAD